MREIAIAAWLATHTVAQIAEPAGAVAAANSAVNIASSSALIYLVLRTFPQQVTEQIQERAAAAKVLAEALLAREREHTEERRTWFELFGPASLEGQKRD